jgi:hypothetical protein
VLDAGGLDAKVGRRADRVDLERKLLGVGLAGLLRREHLTHEKLQPVCRALHHRLADHPGRPTVGLGTNGAEEAATFEDPGTQIAAPTETVNPRQRAARVA